MGRGGRGGGAGRGGRGRGRGNASRGGGRKQGQWDDRNSASSIERSNERFQSYYDTLGIIPEEERDRFWESMRTDLPASFRFTGSRSHALTVQRRLVDRYIPEIVSVEYEGKVVEPPKPVPWYPDQLAWSMTTPKNVIRRFPPFASFQKFLVSENGVGNITRQEIVSMIPPLMMGLKPGMTVLDMCAAPGSKSVQMIEAIHGGEEGRMRKVIMSLLRNGEREGSPGSMGFAEEAEMQQADTEGDYSDDGRATGLLIANDREYKRAQMLIHQCKRINSPNLIITNHDATLYPSLKIDPDPSTGKTRYLKYDRILADVPCSGDGTTRKNLDVWREWKAINGLGLHTQQTRILVRALQMLKAGGRVVYSTCSLNPIEDESVVAAAIDRCGGSEKVTLVDTKDMLPGLERRQGLRHWEVVDRKGSFWSSWEEVAAAREANPRGEAAGKVAETMFPPAPEAEIPLHRCVRVYPHMQDTGGFFIAVLEKQSEIKARPENESGSQVPQPTPVDANEAPISSIVDELANQPVDAARRGDRIEAADAAVPETEPAQLDEGRGQAVERQNNPDVAANGVSKRAIDTDGANDVDERPAKAAKVDVTDLEASARTEHYPLPPAIPPNEHPGTNPTPTFSKDPSQAGLDEEPTVPATADPSTAPATNHTVDFAPGKRQRDTSVSAPTEFFIYLSPEHAVLDAIRQFYDLSPRFPRDRFLVRNPAGDPVKGIYYTTSLVKQILTANEGRGVKFVHAGVKMFVRQDIGHSKDAGEVEKLPPLERGRAWRIQNDGLNIIERWIGPDRVVKLFRRDALKPLLKEMFIKIAPDSSFASLPADFRARLEGMDAGCCVMRCEPTTGAADPETETETETHPFDQRLALPLWRGHSSINIMLPKDDRRAMLLRLFNESDVDLVDNSNVRRRSPHPPPKAERPPHQGRVLQRVAEANSSSDEDDGGGVSLHGGKRQPLEETTAMAAERGDSAVRAVETEVQEKERARDAEVQAEAQMSVDGAPADTS